MTPPASTGPNCLLPHTGPGPRRRARSTWPSHCRAARRRREACRVLASVTTIYAETPPTPTIEGGIKAAGLNRGVHGLDAGAA